MDGDNGRFNRAGTQSPGPGMPVPGTFFEEVEDLQLKVSQQEREKAMVFDHIRKWGSTPKGNEKAGHSPTKDDVTELFTSDIPVHASAAHVMNSFQRVTISEKVESVSEEIRQVCQKILKATELRDKYVFKKREPYWGSIHKEKFARKCEIDAEAQQQIGGTYAYRRRLDPPYLPFPDDIQEGESSEEIRSIFTEREHKFGPSDFQTGFVNGIMQVTVGDSQKAKGFGTVESPPSMKEFYADLFTLIGIVHDAACKSHCYQRLKLLESLFNLHILLNAEKENEAQKTVPHRDFYNVRKVDTHIHHSAIMNQKHLLRFIKSKLKHCPNEVVIQRDGKYLTLSEVFRSLGLTAYDLSIDTLDMHADNTFHRFDRFNLKYNPVGESRLREVFLKSDNMLKGRYLAEVTKEVFSDCEANKYVMLEPRISIYGRNRAEWTKLGSWFYENRLASPNVRWMIQIPRLYSVYKGLGLVKTFQDMLSNIFEPLFAVTLDPSCDPELDNFLNQVTGFDCVDDESRLDPYMNATEFPLPEKWDMAHNPPYSYWIYFIYANLFTLNSLRQSLGMSTFSFRPHAGEAGDMNNLAATFLCAEHINHGILLRKAPTLQYLYYLKQIGLALSPLSNNKLFLDYHSNPFPLFFAQGLNVSLSTDDPLMLHITKDPLVEEYSVAAQVWRLSSTDMCEIARNSVVQSGFEHPYKEHFLGKGYDKTDDKETGYGNNITYTNVPDIRVIYRQERLTAEWEHVRRAAGNDV